MKRSMQIVILIVCSVFSVVAQDTDIPVLRYGDDVRAVLPLRGLESEFQFVGNAGHIIIIEAHVRTDDILTAFHPVISLLNERGSTIAKSMEQTFQYISILPIELTRDGQYTILVNADEYSYLQSDAPFHLRLIRLQQLEPETSVATTIIGESPTYYSIVSDVRFTVAITPNDQALFPNVAVATIESGDFEVLGVLVGQELQAASLTFEPIRNSLHFVELSKPTQQYTIWPINEEVSFIIEVSY